MQKFEGHLLAVSGLDMLEAGKSTLFVLAGASGSGEVLDTLFGSTSLRFQLGSHIWEVLVSMFACLFCLKFVGGADL